MPMISGWQPTRCLDAPKERPLTSGTRTAKSGLRGGRCGFNSESVAGAQLARHDQARRIRSVGGSPCCKELGLAPLGYANAG